MKELLLSSYTVILSSSYWAGGVCIAEAHSHQIKKKRENHSVSGRTNFWVGAQISFTWGDKFSIQPINNHPRHRSLTRTPPKFYFKSMENALQRSPKISKLTCGVCSNVGGEDGDRLSNLPEPIVHHIFSFLETIDVARVSAVSRKWRYLWLSIPYLNFNIQNIWSNPLERWSLQTTNEKFKDFVNWVLLFQNGSISIHRFHLSCLNHVDDYTLYRWIAVVARRIVQVLDLHIISDDPLSCPVPL